jgi:cation diffusion facilitator family transporter
MARVDEGGAVDAQEHKEMRGLQLAIALYVVVFALKLGTYFATHVMALLAEAMHTLSDIIVAGFLLLAHEWSRQPADEDHMFGHERGQSVAALVAATLFVSFTSLRLFEESLPRLVGRGHAVEAPERLDLALGVIVVSMFLAALPLLKLLIDRPKGAAARAQLMELGNDQLGLLAALVGTVFTRMGHPLADALASAAVATMIAIAGARLFRENFDMVVGRSPGSAYLAQLTATAAAIDGVLDVHDLRAERFSASFVRAELHITVRRGLPIEEAHRIEEQVRHALFAVEGCRQVHVHVDASRVV